MKYTATKFGAFGAGLIGGLLATFLFLSVTLAADDIGRERLGFINNGGPAAQSSGRIAGPPPLALRLSAAQSPSPEDNNIYLPLITKE
jgi:hypothetical protein